MDLRNIGALQRAVEIKHSPSSPRPGRDFDNSNEMIREPSPKMSQQRSSLVTQERGLPARIPTIRSHSCPLRSGPPQVPAKLSVPRRRFETIRRRWTQHRI